MKHILLLLLLLSGFSLAQDIKIEVTKETVQQKPKWIIYGKLTIPKNVILTTRLFFGEVEVVNSRQQITTGENQFKYTYALNNSKILEGQYSLEVVCNKKVQFKQNQNKADIPEFTVQLPFYWGNVYTERKQRREYTRFLVDKIQSVNELMEKVEKEGSKYAQLKEEPSKEQREEVRAWIKSIWDTHDQIREDYDKRIYPNVLCPYSMNNYNNFGIIIRQSKDWFEETTDKLASMYRTSSKKFKANPAASRYRDEVKKRMQEILSTERTPANLTIDDLKNDVLWFNQIYGNVSQKFQEAKAAYKESVWKETIDTMNRELEDYVAQINGYQESPLAQKFPNLASEMNKMVQLLKNLAQIYTDILTKADNKDPKILVEALEKQFNIVYELIVKQGEAKNKKREDLIRAIIKHLEILERLEKQLTEKVKASQDEVKNKPGDPKVAAAYQEWAKTWEAEVNKEQEELKTVESQENRKLLQGFPWSLNYAVSSLEKVNAYQKNLLKNENPAKNLEKIRSYQKIFQDTIAAMRAKLQG